ncbi:pirin family protein [Hyphococcus sp.]|uniref:pirin family protein n=1 Tax=Hyphococcus sp. TaxID=2038636 RepID=UPI003D0A78CC
MKEKTANQIIELQKAQPAPGFEMYGLRHAHLDPFMDVTLFHMSEPVFPPHPHAGFSAVSYMTPESEGSFINRDNLGDHARIDPGDTHWTQAGSGMMHEETPAEPGVICTGFQIFVKLSEAEEMSTPEAFHVTASKTPVLNADGWTGKVICGEVNGCAGGLMQTRHDVFLVDVAAEPGAAIRLNLKEGSSAWAFIREGSVLHEDKAVAPVSSILFSQTGDSISLMAGQGGVRALVGGGTPLNQEFLFGGPFAMTTSTRLNEAKRRYASGEMGRLSPSF